MKLAVIVLVCCAMIGQIESQGTGNRPSFIQTFFAPIGQFFSIFRRPTRPGVQAEASIQGQSDTSSSFVDPQQLQESLNSIQQVQAEPVLQTQFVTEVMTVFSTIPSLERVTSIETVVEMTTETVFETVKMTQFKTEHVTMTHTTGVCSTASPSSKAASSSSSSKVVEKSAVTPSAVSTSAAVQPTKKARLAPYVVKRAVEIEASSL
ncbi:uncharacterized protein LOC130697952 [Daphnia carinata]|uniref:uncharacterized protein LOC130697952 n=1 Tax=Daphnia carinata TaxID=120202 RepID=UPI00257C38B4|nr:uncharacterized protein LOC130697952 [Daphnia carinata]